MQIVSSLHRIRTEGMILPFPEPMPAGAGLRLKGRQDCGQSSNFGSWANRGSPNASNALCLACLRYGTPCLDARLRLNASARLSTHLRSIRKSLDVSAPSGVHPAGPHIPSSGLAVSLFDEAPVQKWFRPSTTPPPKDTKPIGYRPVGKSTPAIWLLSFVLSYSSRRILFGWPLAGSLTFSIKEPPTASANCSNLLKTAPPHNCLPLGRVVFFRSVPEERKYETLFLKGTKP